MTQDPQLSAEKVAELEKRLADAAAELAAVQAQLSQVRGSGQPATGATPVPYGDGQPQVVSFSGQQVDLSAYLTPQVAEQIRASFAQLGLDPQLGTVLGAPPVPAAPPTPSHVRLADPPRPVPLAYRLATFDLSFYELFLLLLGLTAPIAVWLFLPEAVPTALVVAVLGIAWFRGRRYVRRIGILKWGRVATVTANETLSAGTYYGGVTYNNMRMRRANGWDASTIWYSGPGYTNQVSYTLDGTPGTLKFRGLLYGDGVVLADSRDPAKAMCVSQFPYSVKPGPDGYFTGELSAWQWFGILVTLVVELSVVYLAASTVVATYVT